MNLRSKNATLYLLALSQISTAVVGSSSSSGGGLHLFWRGKKKNLVGKEVGLKRTSRTLLSRSSSFSSASRCLSTPSNLLISSAANLSGSTWMSFGMRSVRWGGGRATSGRQRVGAFHHHQKPVEEKQDTSKLACRSWKIFNIPLNAAAGFFPSSH